MSATRDNPFGNISVNTMRASRENYAVKADKAASWRSKENQNRSPSCDYFSSKENQARTPSRSPFSRSPSSRWSTENQARTPSRSPSSIGLSSRWSTGNQARTPSRSPFSRSPSSRGSTRNQTRTPSRRRSYGFSERNQSRTPSGRTSSGFNWRPKPNITELDNFLSNAKVIFVGKPFLLDIAKNFQRILKELGDESNSNGIGEIFNHTLVTTIATHQDEDNQVCAVFYEEILSRNNNNIIIVDNSNFFAGAGYFLGRNSVPNVQKCLRRIASKMMSLKQERTVCIVTGDGAKNSAGESHFLKLSQEAKQLGYSCFYAGWEGSTSKVYQREGNIRFDQDYAIRSVRISGTATMVGLTTSWSRYNGEREGTWAIGQHVTFIPNGFTYSDGIKLKNIVRGSSFQIGEKTWQMGGACANCSKGCDVGGCHNQSESAAARKAESQLSEFSFPDSSCVTIEQYPSSK